MTSLAIMRSVLEERLECICELKVVRACNGLVIIGLWFIILDALAAVELFRFSTEF